MYFRNQQRTRLLTVNDNYARLTNIDEHGNLEFEFEYSISQREAIKRQALKVQIHVESRHVARKPLFQNAQRGQIDTQTLIKNAQSALIDAKSTNQQRTRYTLASRISDITSRINNESISNLLSSDTKPTRMKLKLIPASAVKTTNDPQPILDRIAASSTVPDVQLALTASASEQPQTLMHDMILRSGLDPSHVFELQSRIFSARSSHGGLLNPSKGVESTTDSATRLLHRYLFPLTFSSPPNNTDSVIDSELVQVLQPVSVDDVVVRTCVTLPVGKLRLEGAPITQAYVVFNLIESNSGLSIDTVTKVLDVTKHQRVYHTPKIPPIVRAAASEISTRVNLEIKQVDPGATEVELYKKTFWTSTSDVDDYTLIGTYPLSAKDQSLLVQVDKPKNSPAIYRVVPVGKQSVQGFEYTNVAVKSSRYSPVRSASLSAKQTTTGIQLELRHIPSKVTAVQFLRWNMTKHDASYTLVGDNVGFIDDAIRRADLLTIIDTNVTADNVYRYQARLVYRDGQIVECGDFLLEFVRPSPGEVDTRVENLLVEHNPSPNVRFNINTTIIDTSLDAVKKMLENAGLLGYFDDDILTQRDELKKLIAHSVHRIDLNTGQCENFGILTETSFDDDVLRKNRAIQPLTHGHKYRYEIYPLLRSPETLFDGFQKNAIDSVTKKPYTFSPAKFLHPFTLKRGTIVTSGGAMIRQAKDPMAHGVIGSVETVDISLDGETASISDATATNFDRRHNVITWKLLGSIHQVDHFLIMKQVHGMRSLVGKAHSEFANGSCQYLHAISSDDVGSMQYVIIPVHNDYTVGIEVITNAVVVEEL